MSINHQTAQILDIWWHISLYHFHEEKTHIVLKPKVGSDNSIRSATTQSCSRESWCHNSSARHKETKHKDRKTKN